ncbi:MULTISPECIES: carboxylesterase family protein [unclassified Pseudoxanthomonas]|uniref:carboxylesterase/lipase family protein n=1 Tax=unclassified Pseudoxanthomonas TaxID=2645906 RepID=UPI00307820EE
MHPRLRSWLAIATLMLCVSSAQGAARAPDPNAPVVRIEEGLIAGTQADGITRFFGVPYAAPPVGEFRWRAPQPLQPWTGTREARAFSPVCRQTVPWISEPQSEDCLYLNVWAPAGAKKLPVMVWIHGGGFFGGSGSQAGTDGSRLTRQGVIVVTLNYRLGIFGFFAHPELSAESPAKASGNQGILDQIAALRWIQRNIAAFGGDPDRVTIMGESAGANSVAVLVASPLAKGLFQRAIAESGNAALPLDRSENWMFDRTQVEAEGVAFAHQLGTEHLADLRAIDADTLIRKNWAPRTIVDNHLLVEDMETTYRNHCQNDVPILVGWNADEGKDLAPEILGTSDFTAAGHGALLARMLGHTPSAKVLADYPATTDAQARESVFRFTSDYWGWRIWRWADLHAQARSSKPYVYYFVHSPAEPATPCNYGCQAGHGAEIRYVFDQLDQDPRVWSSDDRQLAREIVGYWTSFAKTGDPNGEGLVAWPAFDGNKANVKRLGTTAEIRERGALPDFDSFSDR